MSHRALHTAQRTSRPFSDSPGLSVLCRMRCTVPGRQPQPSPPLPIGRLQEICRLIGPSGQINERILTDSILCIIAFSKAEKKDETGLMNESLVLTHSYL